MRLGSKIVDRNTTAHDLRVKEGLYKLREHVLGAGLIARNHEAGKPWIGGIDEAHAPSVVP